MAGTVPPSTDVGFVQQGQVDWVAFGRTTVSLTIDILARFQAAGVQELTYAGVMQLTTRFKLPDLGRQRVWDAVQSLRVTGGVSNFLYFGFGHKSFLRFLSESISGLKCIALCSCLAEMHSEDVAAKVLAALWKEFDYTENFEPSLHQFKALVKACSGALATSPFPEIASRLLCPKFADINLPHCADPVDIAKALHGLFDVSMGVRQSVTIVGNSECSFIAAVGYWLFNLDVYVEDADGKPLFSSSLSSRPINSMTAQVHVRFMDESEQSGMVLSQSTFILNDPSDIFRSTSDSNSIIFRRRAPWDKCLSIVFGRAFQELCSCRTALSSIFCSVARITLALAEGEVDVGGFDRERYREFADSSYGGAFIDSVETLFPELLELDMRREMEAVLSKPIRNAILLLEESILSLKRSCQCRDCGNSIRATNAQCLLAIAATLTKLVKILSPVRFESDHKLDPTPEGLKSLYKDTLSMTEWSPEDFLYGIGRSTGDYTLPYMMHDLARIFTGYGPFSYPIDSPNNMCTAVSQNGICIFMEGLISMTAKAERLRRIHVMPGHIARTDPKYPNSVYRQYDMIRDLQNECTDVSSLRNIETLPGAQEVAMGEGHTLWKEDKMAAVLVETGASGELFMFYRITTDNHEIIVRPGVLTDCVLRLTGLIPCEKVGCPSEIDQSAPVYTVKSGWVVDADCEEHWISGMCYFWDGTRASEIGRLAALSVQCDSDYSAYHMPYKSMALIRRQECRVCCSTTYMELSRNGSRRAGGKTLIYHII